MRLTLLVVVLIAALPGCVAVPIPGHRNPVTESSTQFIEIGETTKDQITDELGSGVRATFRGQRLWVLEGSSRELGWFVCAGTYTASGCGFAADREWQYIFLTFDEEDIVTEWWLSDTDPTENLGLAIAVEHYGFDVKRKPDQRLEISIDGVIAAAYHICEVSFGWCRVQVGERSYTIRTSSGSLLPVSKDAEILFVIGLNRDSNWREMYFGDAEPFKKRSIYSQSEEAYLVAPSLVAELAN